MNMAAERYDTLEMARVQVYGRTGDLTVKMKNVSSTGALMELVNGDYRPQRGDFIQATIHLDSVGRIHEINGEVVWHDGLGFGINFIRKNDLLTRMMSKS